MDSTHQTRIALNDFFVSVQNKALRQTEIAVTNRDDALDIVQQAMMKLADKYRDQPTLWPQLFQRILQNAIRDWYRRQKVRRLLFWHKEDLDNLEQHASDTIDISEEKSGLATPEKATNTAQNLQKIEQALKTLPARQQQVFLLRAWWGHNVEETAFAMQCSTGSVKTHYSRALQKLQGLLEDLQ